MTIDTWVKSGRVVRLELPLNQFGTASAGRVAVRLDIDRDTPAVTAPAGAVPVDVTGLLGKLVQGFSGLSGASGLQGIPGLGNLGNLGNLGGLGGVHGSPAALPLPLVGAPVEVAGQASARRPRPARPGPSGAPTSDTGEDGRDRRGSEEDRPAVDVHGGQKIRRMP